MNNPIWLALVALIGGGIVRFLWQVAGSNQVYPPSYIVVTTAFTTLCGVVVHFVQRHPFELSARMIGLGSLGGIVAGITVLATVLAFRYGGQGSIVFPIAALSVLVSVMLSVVIYHEPVTATKLLGLGFGVTSIIFLSR